MPDKSFNLYIMLASYETVCSDLCSSLYQRTPLHMAVKGGHMDIVEYLIVKKHADINSKDIKGVSPHISIFRNWSLSYPSSLLMPNTCPLTAFVCFNHCKNI